MKLAIRLSGEKDFEELIHFFVYSINTIACLLSKKKWHSIEIWKWRYLFQLAQINKAYNLVGAMPEYEFDTEYCGIGIDTIWFI